MTNSVGVLSHYFNILQLVLVDFDAFIALVKDLGYAARVRQQVQVLVFVLRAGLGGRLEKIADQQVEKLAVANQINWWRVIARV